MGGSLGKSSLLRGVRRASEYRALLAIPALCGLMAYEARRPADDAAVWRDRLQAAAHAGDVEGLREAIRHGADLDFTDHEGRTPLHYAAAWNQPRSAAALLEAGASVSGATDEVMSPLGLAALLGSDEAAGELLAHGADPNRQTDGFTPLCLACRHPRGSADLVRRLLGAGARVDGRSRGGQTALMAAAAAADAEGVRALLEAGADPAARDDAGRSAQDYAAGRGGGS